MEEAATDVTMKDLEDKPKFGQVSPNTEMEPSAPSTSKAVAAANEDSNMAEGDGDDDDEDGDGAEIMAAKEAAAKAEVQ